MPSEQTCSVIKSDNYGFHFSTCGKKATGKLANGEPACARHLSGERLRMRNQEKRIQERQELEARKSAAADLHAAEKRVVEAAIVWKAAESAPYVKAAAELEQAVMALLALRTGETEPGGEG